MEYLTAQESYLIRLFFYLSPLWKKKISSQLKNATVSRTDCVSSYFVNFDVDDSSNRINTNTQVPAEIIVGYFDVPEEQIICTINGLRIIQPCTFAVGDDQAFGVRLHFKNGCLFELEAYSLAGNKLDLSLALERPYVCIVHDKTAVGHQLER